jgi:hypothetical protein
MSSPSRIRDKFCKHYQCYQSSSARDTWQHSVMCLRQISKKLRRLCSPFPDCLYISRKLYGRLRRSSLQRLRNNRKDGMLYSSMRLGQHSPSRKCRSLCKPNLWCFHMFLQCILCKPHSKCLDSHAPYKKGNLFPNFHNRFCL